MDTVNRKWSWVAVACFAALQVAGFLHPDTLTWGFHAPGFLPSWVLVAVIAVAFAALYAPDRMGAGAVRLGEAMDRSPRVFVTGTILLMGAIAVLLRIRVPLLGDSFFIVQNFSDSLRGVSPLLPRNEPLATYFFAAVLNLRPPHNYAGFLERFLIGEIILCTGFVIVVFRLARALFPDRSLRLPATGFLLALPYVQLFFGYIEVYSVVLFALALYALAAIRCLRDEWSFRAAATCYALLVLTHFLSLLLLPSIVYLAVLEYRRAGFRQIAAGLAIASGMALALLAAAGFDLERFSALVPYRQWLSLSTPSEPAEARSQAYTLLSWYHGIDILNFMILMGSASGFLCLASTAKNGASVLWNSPLKRFLLLAILPVAAFLMVVKLGLGAAKDWDVLAPYAFMVALLALAAADFPRAAEIVTAVAVLAALNTGMYCTLNSTADRSIRRYDALLDTRTMSYYAFYIGCRHLAQYYHQVNDEKGASGAWERLVAAYPGEPEGYENLVSNLRSEARQDTGKIRMLYDRWVRVSPGDTRLVNAYRNFCVDAGNGYFGSGDLAQAKSYYRKALDLDPEYVTACNNLGSVYARQDSIGKAVELFRRAVGLDPAYPQALYNLGTALEQTGDLKESIRMLRRAAELGNPDAKEKLQESRERR